MSTKAIIKNALGVLGYEIRRRDPLAAQIPAYYETSPFLPPIRRGMVGRVLYFMDMLERTADLPGDIVECGVSIGHGALLFLLLSEQAGLTRSYCGFDSFEGFPDPVEKDGKTPITGPGFFANAPEVVQRTLRDGRLPDTVIEQRVRLIKGWFEDTVPRYDGQIAILHLDCDLYESYRTCLSTLYDKVVPRGIIMFDEYDGKWWPGAKKAIDEFFLNKPERVEKHARGNRYYAVKQ